MGVPGRGVPDTGVFVLGVLDVGWLNLGWRVLAVEGGGSPWVFHLGQRVLVG